MTGYTGIVDTNASQRISPEFYTLSFLEKRYPDSSSLAALENSVASSPSIDMSSRDHKNRHDDIVRRRKIETLKPQKTIPEQVVHMMRVSERKLYSRGHVVPVPGSPLTRHPPNSQPVVLRNNEMGSTGRNSGTFRPPTASEQRKASAGMLKRTISREDVSKLYIKPTLDKILNSSGQAIPMHCSKSSWRFQRPLDRICYTRPSAVSSSLLFSTVPDCAECILTDGPYATLAGAAKQKILDKTTKEDKVRAILFPPLVSWYSRSERRTLNYI